MDAFKCSSQYQIANICSFKFIGLLVVYPLPLSSVVVAVEPETVVAETVEPPVEAEPPVAPETVEPPVVVEPPVAPETVEPPVEVEPPVAPETVEPPVVVEPPETVDPPH